MKKTLRILLTFAAILILILLAIRMFDFYSDQAEWERLIQLQPERPALFSPAQIENLPEPARRFLAFSIQPGTPLFKVAEINMGGKFSLGSRENPAYQEMEARQILASPLGFVWSLNLPGAIPVSGSDSAGWTRFRVLGLIPVARMGGDANHARSAYGRMVAESVFWTPAAVLPGPNIEWQSLGKNSARVIIRKQKLAQAVDVHVDADGRPLEVVFQRWTNANPEKKFKYQPFGGKLSDFREVQGFTVPFKVEAGNMYGTEDEFTFFKAEVQSIRFIQK